MPSGHAKRKRYVHKKEGIKVPEVRNEINVTPLVDVCLVLLIIFMVILPMLTRGKEVPLPKTRNHAEGKDTQQPIVAIDRGGAIYVDQDKVKDVKEMKKKVQELWTALAQRYQGLQSMSDVNTGADLRSGEGRVLLKVDADLNYGRVYPVIMGLHEIQAIGIDLGTNEVKDEAAE